MITRPHEHRRSPRISPTGLPGPRYKALHPPGRPNGRGWTEPRPCEAPDETLRPDRFRGRQGWRSLKALPIQSLGREPRPQSCFLEEAGGEPRETG